VARSTVGVEASDDDTQSMVSLLEKVGRILQPLDLRTAYDGLPDEVTSNQEKLTRFLLLVAFLDQQAESPTARRTAVSIYRKFGEDLFFKPQRALLKLDELVPLKTQYKISLAIGRVLPRFGWFVLRVGGFLIYEMMLNEKRLSVALGECETPRQAIALLHGNPVVESILRHKAVRMYISWIGHPDLGVNVSNGVWNKASFEMPVDGHVGKVFSRTGMVQEVIHERKKGKSARWNIISASEMRPSIQDVTSQFSDDPIAVDHGAFQIGFHCCTDKVENVSCDVCQKKFFCEIRDKIGCDGVCILRDYCRKNLTWRAY